MLLRLTRGSVTIFLAGLKSSLSPFNQIIWIEPAFYVMNILLFGSFIFGEGEKSAWNMDVGPW